MRNLIDYFMVAWTYKFSLLPVLSIYLLIDIPALHPARHADAKFWIRNRSGSAHRGGLSVVVAIVG